MKKIIYLLMMLIALLLLSCSQDNIKKESKPAEGQDYMAEGKEIVEASFSTLSKHLAKAISEGGVPDAIGYCSLKAYPLTDSLSQAYNAKIRRTSLKVRNPENRPNSLEMEVLKEYAHLHEKGAELKPMIKAASDGKVAYFSPIKINSMVCLNCHGVLGEELKVENYEIIKEKYPEDEAIGYDITDFRGMWSIVFEK